MRTAAQIAQRVRTGQLLATIDDVELTAPLDGIVRGLTRDGGVPVQAGTKVLEVDPRGDPAAVVGIGERPRRIADAVLRALEARVAGQPAS